jgi:hypothetical protein
VSTALTHECSNCDKLLDDAPTPAKKRKHIVDSLKPDAIDPAAARVAVSNCSSHPMSRVDMHCADCGEALCAKCAFADHQGHAVTGIEEVTDLARKVRSFWQAALERAVSADASVADVTAARTSLGACGQRVVAKLTASKTAALKAVADYFDHMIAIVNTEVGERDKALASQERECSVAAAQLRAGGGVCETALAAGNSIALVSALHTAELMTPMLKPFGGLAAATDMDMLVDLAPLTAALERMCEFVQFPVDAATSEVSSASMPGAVDAAAAAAGGADAADADGVLLEDANTVTLIARGAAGNIVQLREDEVRLSVCDAEGRAVGVCSVAIREDASVHMKFRLTDSAVRQPVLTVYVRGAGLKCWTSRRLVSDVLCHFLVCCDWMQ